MSLARHGASKVAETNPDYRATVEHHKLRGTHFCSSE